LLECERYLKHIAQADLHAELRSKVDASDVVQATLLKAQQGFADFTGRDRESLQRWLKQILTNTIKDLARKYQLAEKRRISKEVSLDADSQGVFQERIVSPDPTPSENAMHDEQDEAIRVAMQRLPEQYRKVIFLRSRKVLGFEDIGRLMQRSPEAVRLLWYRAVRQLAQELDKRSSSEQL